MNRRLFMLFSLACLAGCSSQAPPSDRLSVAVSFYPLEFLAERIGGDNADVWSMLPEGTEPHDVEPLASDVARLEHADLFFYNGLGLDAWAEDLAKGLPKTVHAVRVTDGLTDLLTLDTKRDRQFGAFDPHVWLDGGLIQAIARDIGSNFAAADPEHAAEYGKRTAGLVAELRSLDERYRQELADCQRRDIITGHDAFEYLGWRHQLTMHPIAGISPEAEPSPRDLARLSDMVNELGITTVFFETLTSPELSETLAREAGATTAVLHTLEGITAEQRAANEDYLSLMKENLASLRTALDCQ